MEMWVNEFWIFIAYIIGTAFGWYIKSTNDAGAVIDALIEKGYLKTQGKGKDMKILKWDESEND